MKLVPATFLERPNRFIVHARLEDGSEVRAHLADPGRLRELLLPGAELQLRPAPPGRARATDYTVHLVRTQGDSPVWVSVETTLANRLAHDLLVHGEIPAIGNGWNVRAEVRCGKSRFDFLLTHEDRPDMWVEVKSVTLVEDGIGLFPDAPTERGRRHVQELAERVGAGDRAAVLFVAQREDVTEVRPHDTLDPDFAAELRRAEARGVTVTAVRFRLDPTTSPAYRGTLPVRTWGQVSF